MLLHLLQDKNIESVLVFTRTKHGADKVARILGRSGVKAEAIHGNKSQNARIKAMNNFRDHITRVLIATDIAARGIDIDHLSHVINYDLPNIPETYVHRIGRTGRAGRSGAAFSFCDSEEKVYLKDIERLTGRHIPEIQEHPFNAGVVRPVSVFSEKEELKRTVRREDRKNSRNSRFQNSLGSRSDVRA